MVGDSRELDRETRWQGQAAARRMGNVRRAATYPAAVLASVSQLYLQSTDCLSATGENRREAGLRQDALHLFSFVTLDFDAAIFHRAADTAGFLHLLGEFLFLH